MGEEAIESSQARTHLRFVPEGQGWRHKVRELKRGIGSARDDRRRLYRHPNGEEEEDFGHRTGEPGRVCLVELVFNVRFEEWENLAGRN